MGEWMLVLTAGAVRVLYLVAWSLRESARNRSLVALVRAAGPGATVLDRRADGGVLAVRTHGPAEGALSKGTVR
ncbi:hypothetical protein P3T36_006439 [Kitasatospora sp. MAP12-15]|uniref:hypothetical protein n=1 Tax=unclassified Kitasatospora TaxID=2633591 RepID=UPI002474998A|nr:hypothetical protein [Kitasatospora sp. MAP12-44]MDH6107827.1 hypothetical protein [Kitasatospora sp. MAP12-44]